LATADAQAVLWKAVARPIPDDAAATAASNAGDNTEDEEPYQGADAYVHAAATAAAAQEASKEPPALTGGARARSVPPHRTPSAPASECFSPAHVADVVRDTLLRDHDPQLCQLVAAMIHRIARLTARRERKKNKMRTDAPARDYDPTFFAYRLADMIRDTMQRDYGSAVAETNASLIRVCSKPVNA
jgi:hypothetical protein